MSNFKGKDSTKKQIDFDSEASLNSIVAEIGKQKLSGNKSIAARLISFITSNAKLTAILAGYFIISGIVINIYGIYQLIKFTINLF